MIASESQEDGEAKLSRNGATGTPPGTLALPLRLSAPLFHCFLAVQGGGWPEKRLWCVIGVNQSPRPLLWRRCWLTACSAPICALHCRRNRLKTTPDQPTRQCADCDGH